MHLKLLLLFGFFVCVENEYFPTVELQSSFFTADLLSSQPLFDLKFHSIRFPCCLPCQCVGKYGDVRCVCCAHCWEWRLKVRSIFIHFSVASSLRLSQQLFFARSLALFFSLPFCVSQSMYSCLPISHHQPSFFLPLAIPRYRKFRAVNKICMHTF